MVVVSSRPLVAALACASLLAFPLHAGEGEAPEPIVVTAEELWADPERYEGKLVRLDEVVWSDCRRSRGPREARDDFILDTGLYVTAFVRAPVAPGDRVRVTGRFTSGTRSFAPRGLILRPPEGKVQMAPVGAEGDDAPVTHGKGCLRGPEEPVN